jgi:hypothetical protein
MVFKKGMKVAKVIVGAGQKTATIQIVEKASKKNGVQLEGEGYLRYDSKGDEIDPAILGWSSFIVPLEDQE